MPKKINIDDLVIGYQDYKGEGKEKILSREETLKFVNRLKEMSESYKNVTPEDFITLFIKENGYQNNVLWLDQKSKADTNKSGGKARGLIQFVPSTAKSLGLDQSKLSEMSPVEQLEYVDKFYKNYKNNIDGYESLYLTTFYPAAVNQSDDFVIAKQDQVAYTSNKAIDQNQDGQITRADFIQYAQNTSPADQSGVFDEVTQDEYDLAYINYANEATQINEPNIVAINPPLDAEDPRPYLEITKEDNQGNLIPERKYFNEGESLYVETIGSNQYVSKTRKNDEGIIQRDLFGINKNELSNEISLERRAPASVYQKEIANVTEGKLTPEKVRQAENILEQAEEHMLELGDQEKNIHAQQLQDIQNKFYQDVKIPYIQKDIENMRLQKQRRLTDLKHQLRQATGEEKENLQEQVAQAEKEYNESIDAENTTNQLVERAKKGDFLSGTPKRWDFKDGLAKKEKFIIDSYKAIEEEYNKYTAKPIYKTYAETQTKDPNVNKPIAGDLNDTTKGTLNTKVGTTNQTDQSTGVNLIDMQVPEETPYDSKIEVPKSTEALEAEREAWQGVIDANQIDLSVPGVEEKEDYSNIIGNLMDVGRGILGAKGALQEVPQYEESAMFRDYLDEASRQRNMGLSPEEEAYRKQLSERAYGYDISNIRRLTGGSSGVALANMGRAAGSLQNRYAQIASEDSAVRRMNQQRFDQAAVRGETVNRQKFQDDYNQTILNKRAGAQLLQDSINNMNERAQFEKYYGKGSTHDELQKAILNRQQKASKLLDVSMQNQSARNKAMATERISSIDEELKAIKEQNKNRS